MSIPKDHFWGVDSFMHIDDATGGKASLFEFVMDKVKNRAPDFWGRYIGEKGSKMRKSEITLLRRFSPKTRLLIVFNAPIIPIKTKFTTPAQDRARGDADAGRADNATSEVDVPSDVVIYANVEPKTGVVSADWIQGWCEGMQRRSRVGGLYGNVSDPGRGFIGKAFNDARALMNNRLNPPLWSQNPHNGFFKLANNIDFDYSPGEPPGAPGTALVWQHAVSFFKFKVIDRSGEEKEIGRFDSNLATQRGFDLMWKLTPLPLPSTIETFDAGRESHFIDSSGGIKRITERK